MIKDKFKVKTVDGVEIVGIKYIPTNPIGVIYISHGYTVPKEGPSNVLVKTAETLADNGFKVVAYDFRGHGESGGLDVDVTMESGLLDLDAVIKEDRTQNLPIGFLGFSYGGAMSIMYADKYEIDVKSMVLFSPALEMWESSFLNHTSVLGQFYNNSLSNGELVKYNYFKLPTGFKIGEKFVDSTKQVLPYNHLKNLDSKILIIQAMRDQMLSFKKMKELGEPYADKYVTLDDVHGLVEKIDEAILETVNWYKETLK